MVVRTVAIPDLDDLVAHLPDRAPLAWVRQGDGLVGWGVAATIAVSGTQRFAQASAWWREMCAELLLMTRYVSAAPDRWPSAASPSTRAADHPC